MQKNTENGSCLVIFVVVLALLLAGITAVIIYFDSLPPISQLQNYQPTMVSQIVSSDGVVIKTFGAYNYKKVSFDQIPDNLKKAIIATEDKNFYKHRGFDVEALARSMLSNIMARRVVQGASTITQQLARILFLSSEKTFDRKFKELIIAYRLEKTIPKDEILTMYLNNVYLGEGAYGVSAAAEVYFNKKVKDLNLAESALIAGLPQAPSAYSPYQNMKYAKERRAMVLKRMIEEGLITPEQQQKANDTPIIINKYHRPSLTNKAPYFVDLVTKELATSAGITEQELIQGGYKVYTTLDYEDQKIAQNAVDIGLAKWGLRKNYQQAALISFDAATGKILAYLGGKDYSISQYDRVSQSIRPPGSAFKMFVYTTAMERGMDPNTIYQDSPFSIGDWSPHNYGNKYRGKIPLYKALAISSNVVAVRLIQDVGVDSVINMARRLGITTTLAHDSTIALGSNGVKLIELADAYGALANGGIRVLPHTVEKVEASDGRIIYRYNNIYNRVLDAKTVSKMVDMLKQVITIGTGRAANIGKPVAGKTGTTDNYRDAWFMGFSPDVVTGVWVGNDNNTPTKGLTGATAPATIWSQYMRKVLSSKPNNDFSVPDAVMDQNNKKHDPFAQSSSEIPIGNEENNSQQSNGANQDNLNNQENPDNNANNGSVEAPTVPTNNNAASSNYNTVIHRRQPEPPPPEPPIPEESKTSDENSGY